MAFPERAAACLIASIVMVLTDLYSFSAEEWILEKILTGCLPAVRAQASVTWQPFYKHFSFVYFQNHREQYQEIQTVFPLVLLHHFHQ